MRVNFNIDYRCTFGEQLSLNVCLPDGVTTYRLSTTDGERWTYQLSLPDNFPTTLSYYYSVDRGDEEIRKEWAVLPHLLALSADEANEYTVYNRWGDIPEDAYLYSSAVTDCLNRRKVKALQASHYDRTVRLIVRAPQLRGNERLAVIGDSDALGAWEARRAKPMTEHQPNEWVIDLDAEAFSQRAIEFKFVALDSENDASPLWETCLNRTIELPALRDGELVCYELDQAFFPIYNRRLAGTLVPVFSLRTESSFGVGDFGDLVTMIDYVAATSQNVLQVLPINDTTSTGTWTDSYPYSAISIFALHPMFVDVRQLPALKDAKLRREFETLRNELNALPAIDYERVNQAKRQYMEALFKQEGKAMMATKAFDEFFHQSERWLVPYAQFCHLSEQNHRAPFSQWPDHKQWNEADREELSNPKSKAWSEVAFYYFMQFVLHTQMSHAHDHARSKGVILKGDIPIGVARAGCDVWMEPQYFNLNGQAGAPPDDFSVNGQNWGMPTYNWEAMLRDGCQWWVRRFQNMAHYFDAYRIDHVLGFFRIWEIPYNSVHGLLGQFRPSLGMTREEIEGYGLPFYEEQFCEPFISDWVLNRVFGNRADEVKQNYLVHSHDDIWHLAEEFNTQRKIEKAFEHCTDTEELNLRDGLYALVSNVLFVRDATDANKFHPRISAQFDFTYEALWDKDKAAFNRLYNFYYYRRNNQFWYGEAMRKLPKLVEATRMLVCAEDLGMVPDCVAWVMNQLRILSLEIQSMPKDPTVRFGHLSANPYRSVCTFSSHDMPTLRQWWDENQERTQDYYNSMLYHGGPAPHPLPGWLAHDILSRQLTSPSMLCVLSIQDWLAMDEEIRLPDANAERINIPSNPKHYWRYRMHVSIEQLMANKDFMARVRGMVKESGR